MTTPCTHSRRNWRRTDLDARTDYTTPQHQDVKDAGPIPESTYTLSLTANMNYLKTGAGWGVGGWPLEESGLDWVGNFFGGRYGFFLHDDGGSRGTGGCIGVQSSADMGKLKSLLMEAYAQGQREVTVKVDYAD